MSPHLVVAHFIAILILSGMARSAQAQSSYPIVNQTMQRERDADRRFILETELQAERRTLAKAQAALDSGPNQERELEVHRHVENVKALQRELDGVASEPREAPAPARGIVKAVRPAATRVNKLSRFWDPYERTTQTTDFSTTP